MEKQSVHILDRVCYHDSIVLQLRVKWSSKWAKITKHLVGKGSSNMPFVELLITAVIEVEGTAVELMLQAPYACKSTQFSSVQFSLSVVSDSLQPHEPQHVRPPCPSPTPGVPPNPCPLSPCHPASHPL